MTQDEIIEMVRIAEDKVIANKNLDWKIEFAKLVADVATAKEREACAKICGEYNFGQAPKMIQDSILARSISRGEA